MFVLQIFCFFIFFLRLVCLFRKDSDFPGYAIDLFPLTMVPILEEDCSYSFAPCRSLPYIPIFWELFIIVLANDNLFFNPF